MGGSFNNTDEFTVNDSTLLIPSTLLPFTCKVCKFKVPQVIEDDDDITFCFNAKPDVKADESTLFYRSTISPTTDDYGIVPVDIRAPDIVGG